MRCSPCSCRLLHYPEKPALAIAFLNCTVTNFSSVLGVSFTSLAPACRGKCIHDQSEMGGSSLILWRGYPESPLS